jgi:hypothetical protein
MMRINSIQQAIVIAAAVCATSTLGLAQETTKGSIIWTGGYVSGIGVGTAKPSGNKAIDRIQATRAAEVIAQRSLLETIKGVKINSVTTVENMVMVEDKINSRIEGIVKGAEIYDAKVEWEDGMPIARVEMRVCLSAEMNGCKGTGLASALNLEQLKTPPHAPAESLPLDAPVQAAQQPAPARGKNAATYDGNRKVTGLVLNLEGQYFEREMLPIVATKTGDRLVTVYCVKNVKPSVVRSYGAVRYADTLDQVVKIAELGDNLLVMPVAEVTKENMVIITPENANILRQTMMNGNDYLNDAKVAISTR